MRTTLAILIAVALAAPRPAAAQTPADTTAARPDPAAAPAPAAPTRLSWTSDRLPLRVGDLITVVVDEATAASERVSKVATGDHSLSAKLNASVGQDVRIGPEKQFGSGLNSGSRDVGETGRKGELTAVLTVRVMGFPSDGIVQIEGQKKVTVDGRVQDIGLRGLVRLQDISPTNQVVSSRIADAEITYKGKKIGPSLGIAGRFLSMLWP